VRRAILAVLGLVAFSEPISTSVPSTSLTSFTAGTRFTTTSGRKYSRELSYDRLYECVAVADSELPALRRRVELRKLTNLRTNILETTADILAHPERCKQHFTARSLAVVSPRPGLLPHLGECAPLGRRPGRPWLQRHPGVEHRGLAAR